MIRVKYMLKKRYVPQPDDPKPVLYEHPDRFWNKIYLGHPREPEVIMPG